MSTIQVDPDSWRMTIILLGNARVSMNVAARAALKAAGETLLYRVRQNASRTDNTEEDLARKDHPYARRHGVIQASKLGPAFVKRPYMVHTRSGAFLAAMQGGATGTDSKPSFDVHAVNSVPWVKYVILGTRVMLPRDIIWNTAHEKETKVLMMRAVVDVLGRGLRTQSVVRFG